MSRTMRISQLSLHRCHKKSKSYTSWSLILQLAIIILITQLVNSQRLNGGITSNDNPEDRQKKAGFKFRSQDFEVSFEVFRNDDKGRKFYNPSIDSDKEALDKAIQEIFDSPGQFPNKNDSGGSGFIKPRQSDRIDPAVFKPHIPPECENELICTIDLSYPDEAVDEVAKNLKDLRVLAGVDATLIGDRTSDDGSENICQAKYDVWFPKSLRESRSEPWHRVYNVPSLMQGVRVGHCRTEGGTCDKDFGMPKAGKISICKQQYSYRQIAVLDPVNGTSYGKMFPLPSGCCCHLRSRSSRMSRNTRHSGHMHNQPWFINNHYNRSRK